MSKTRNWYTKAIYLVIALVLTLGLVIVPAVSADPAYTEIGGCLGTCDTEDVAQWSTTPVHPDPETLTVMGVYSAFLDKNAGDAGSTYVQFVPDAGVTLADLDDIAAASEWSFWHWSEAVFGQYAQLELQFTMPGYDSTTGWGHVDVTLMPLQNMIGAGDWVKQTVLATDKPAWVYYGNDPTDGTAFDNAPGSDAGVADLTGIEALINAEGAMTAGSDTASAWELTRVRIELWEAGDRSCYIDDITIDGERYDLEPDYSLEPDIAKNVKTTDATFTVVDSCGVAIPAALVSNWVVTKGEGIGDVTIVAGGLTAIPDAAPHNYITVRMVTTGDCIITVDVDQDPGEGEDIVTLHAEKKWGEIYYTELTAWSDTPCEQRPTGAADTEISRVINLGGLTTKDVLVQEAVIANFLPGPVPAYAGGAKITWWLLENDEADLAQTALEELLELFDSYDYVSGELGYGHGCGQYAEWAITNPDPDFIPEDLIDAIYALYEANDTLFTDAECAAIVDTTKTVTYTDHFGDPLGEGFTNVLVEFSEVGTTDLAEHVIVVVLADYPLDKNGQNAVCVEYFKFKSTVIVAPEVAEVKTPQLRWAGEKIDLEKDWSDLVSERGQLADYWVEYNLEFGSVGTLHPVGDHTPYSEGLVEALLDADGISRCILESEQAGEADVDAALYYNPGEEDPDELVSEMGFLVYFLEFEDVTLADDITPESSLSNLTPVTDDAEVAVRVRGFFDYRHSHLMATMRLEQPIDLNDDGVADKILPAGRYVLPDDWWLIAETEDIGLRPNFDLMDRPDDNITSANELGPYNTDVRTTDPPGEADNPCIGPFNTLQQWSTFDMWIADDTVPADFTVALPTTLPRTIADVRNTVVPDGIIDEWDAPMPQALVIFDVVSATGTLSGLDKGDLEGYGISGGLYQSPFYAVEIPSSPSIPAFGYNWNSWGGDGPYDYWTDLQLKSIISNTAEVPVVTTDVEVYCDNHGIAAVTIDALIATGTVTITATAEFPYTPKRGKYGPRVSDEIDVYWGQAIEHLNPDFEAVPRSGASPLTVDFENWTEGGTPDYVEAKWDFNGDGVAEITLTGTHAEVMADVEWTFDFPGYYTIALTMTDSTLPDLGPLVHTETKIGYVTVEGSHPYDDNHNGEIDRDEVVRAVLDYFDGQMSKAKLIEILLLYFG